MPQYLTIPRFIATLIIMGAIGVPIHTTHAQSLADIVKTTLSQVQPAPADSTPQKDSPIEKKDTPVENTKTVEPAASTKVAATSTLDTPKNSALQDILNEIIKPAEVYTPPTTTQQKAQPAPETSTAVTPLKTTAKATSTKATSTRATTTPAALTSSPDNSTPSATNYYTPLDTLSPAATFGLSGIALASGFLGSFFVLRDPHFARRRREVSATSFAPRNPFNEPLLDQ